MILEFIVTNASYTFVCILLEKLHTADLVFVTALQVSSLPWTASASSLILSMVSTMLINIYVISSRALASEYTTENLLFEYQLNEY